MGLSLSTIDFGKEMYESDEIDCFPHLPPYGYGQGKRAGKGRARFSEMWPSWFRP